MSQTTRNQLWTYRLSVALDSLYPLQNLDFVEPLEEDEERNSGQPGAT